MEYFKGLFKKEIDTTQQRASIPSITLSRRRPDNRSTTSDRMDGITERIGGPREVPSKEKLDIPLLNSIEKKEGCKLCYVYDSEAYYDYVHDGRSMYTEILVNNISVISFDNIAIALLCMRYHNVCPELGVSILKSDTYNIIIRCIDYRTKNFIVRKTDQDVPKIPVLYERGSEKRMGKLNKLRVENIPYSFIRACIAKHQAEQNMKKECTDEIMQFISEPSMLGF